MNFPQYGTTATSIIGPLIITPISSIHVTSTIAYDIHQLFLRTKIQLEKLEMSSIGTNEDLETVKTNLHYLPRFSKERLELDIRIQSLKKKWGLIERAIPETRNEITFPIEISSVDEFLIENSNIEYIDSELDGREWIISRIKKRNVSKIDSENKLNEILHEVIEELNQIIDDIHEASSFSEWKSSLSKIGIILSEEHILLFEYWSTNEKNKQKTIGQLKTWISNNEDIIFSNNKVADTISYNLIEKMNVKESNK